MAKWLKSASVSDSDVARAKNELKISMLSEISNTAQMHENMAMQMVMTGKITPTMSLVAEVEKISSSDVNNVNEKYFFCIIANILRS